MKSRTSPAKSRSQRRRAGPSAGPTDRTTAERLQKALARAGLGSRREIEVWIRAGRLTVNGEVATLGRRVSPGDHLRLDGRLIRQRVRAGAQAPVFLCHRSPGEPLRPLQENQDGGESGGAGNTDSAVAEDAGSLLERLPRRAGKRFIAVSPMPRVDGGLELVTSDGDQAARLQRAMRTLLVEFSVRIHGALNEQGLDAVLQGRLDDGRRLRISACTAAGGEGSNRWYALAALGASGKDVRQLFERQGALVSRILRTRLGTLVLDRHMPRGRFRELGEEELRLLTTPAALPDPEAAHRMPDP